MSTKLIKNYTVSKKIGIAHPTIARWVDNALKNENNLQIGEKKGRYFIIDNDHNWAEIDRLKEKALKFRNKKSFEHIDAPDILYKIFDEAQLIDIISSIETYHEIPLRYSFYNEGAFWWKDYKKSQKDRKHASSQVKLAELLQSFEILLYLKT